jgi:PIN domain nuclease of toxin-antitoxin system
MLYILDTHVLIWYFIGSTRLTRAVKEKIEEVRSMGGRLLVPTIVLAEALSVAEKGKVTFDFPEMYHRIKAEPEFEIISFTPEIMEEVTALAIPEIHDRIIVATARFYQAGILTKDKIIRDTGDVETVC